MSSRKGLSVVICGAAGSMGQRLLHKLLQEGCEVAVIVRNSSQLSGPDDSGSKFLVVECDLADEESRNQAWQLITHWSSAIDVFIYVAGTAFGAPALMTKQEALKHTFEINYFAAIDFCQKIAKKMIRKKSGLIVNVSSIQGELATKGNLAYGGSKAALNHSTRILSQELGKFGIRVNAILPTVMDNRMGKKMDIEEKAKLVERTALSTTTTEQDVVNLIVFLMSEEASQISGQLLRVDGGLE